MGLTAIIVDSTISQKARKWLDDHLPQRFKGLWITKFVSEMSNCYQCTGFWVGLLLGVFLIGTHWYWMLCCGFVGSTAASWGTLYFTYLEAQTLINIDQGEQQNS